MGAAESKFLKLFLPVLAVVVIIGGYWIAAHSGIGRDRSYAKDHPISFLAANSVGDAMLELDLCLRQYALVKGDDGFPDDLGSLGPDGLRCVSADLAGGVSRLNYRFAYYPTERDAKGKALGFQLYAYPVLLLNGQPVPDGTPAEYFASADGVVLVRMDLGTAKEHIEPYLGLPKTLQVLSAKLKNSGLPTDQQGILRALGPEASPGYSTVPKGYAGLWTADDNDAAVVWTNLGEGYLYSYRPEHRAAPAHFTLLARPVHLVIPGVDTNLRRTRHYFLNESGVVHVTFLAREATTTDPEVANCERSGDSCDLAWTRPPS